ncbi:hypothetical protein [Flavobacterium sp.]|uniref:hypothetical protein n=1 Tax=Flavobacterium sp. TaxID=239 RepID=UPI003267D691
MKKFIGIFFIFNLTTTLGQTLSYTATASYNYVTCTGSGLNCSTSYINYSFSGASGQDQILNSSNPTITKVYSNIPLAGSYTFSSSGCYCLYNNGTVQVLPVPSSGTQSIGNLIQNNNANLLLSGCFGNAFFSGFKPNNVSVQNLGSTSTVCAGEQLNMVALPAGYPPEAYNWQYSIDNQVTWVTVPKKMINGISTNNTTTSNFTIYDIFGADHINHFGSIYFRIGYTGRPFSASSIKINYSPCAPLVTNVDFVGPKCNGDGIQKLDIYFKDPLDASKNESLYQLYVRETTNNTGIIKTTPFMLVSDVSYSSISKVYSYTNFSSFSSLENGREYEIIYQAQVKHPTNTNPAIKILKGFLVGSNPFRYREPDPLKFEIKKADNPKCPDDFVEVAISVEGGTGDYKFYVDGNEKTNPKPIKEVDEYYHIRGLVPTDINSIKVMDENNCIEKTL